MRIEDCVFKINMIYWFIGFGGQLLMAGSMYILIDSQ